MLKWKRTFREPDTFRCAFWGCHSSDIDIFHAEFRVIEYEFPEDYSFSNGRTGKDIEET